MTFLMILIGGVAITAFIMLLHYTGKFVYFIIDDDSDGYDTPPRIFMGFLFYACVSAVLTIAWLVGTGITSALKAALGAQ